MKDVADSAWEYLCERRERLYVVCILVVWALAESIVDLIN